jgi:hypothetical protein
MSVTIVVVLGNQSLAEIIADFRAWQQRNGTGPHFGENPEGHPATRMFERLISVKHAASKVKGGELIRKEATQVIAGAVRMIFESSTPMPGITRAGEPGDDANNMVPPWYLIPFHPHGPNPYSVFAGLVDRAGSLTDEGLKSEYNEVINLFAANLGTADTGGFTSTAAAARA